MALKDFKLENLPRSMQLLLFAALAAGLVIVFYMFYMKGLMEERDTLLGDVRRLEISVAQATAIESQHERFKRELADLEQRLNVLRSILPSQKETPQVLRSIQSMAITSNLKITKFAPQTVIPRAFYSDWPLQIEVEGSYDAMGYFFEKVSQSTRIINVDNITVHGIDGSTDSARTLNAVCTATTFVFREDQAIESTKQERKR